MAAAAQTTALVPHNPEPPPPPPDPEPPAWLKSLLAIGGVVLTIGGIAWAVRRHLRETKAVAPTRPTAALPASSTTAPPRATIPRRPSMIAPMPAPENPWGELERLMAVAPHPQPVEAEGDGDTAAGVHYVWRVYKTDPAMSTAQAVVMVQDADGSWSYWGQDPSSPQFVISPNVEEAMDRIMDWAEAN